MVAGNAIDVRFFKATDVDTLYEINEAAVPGVGSVTHDAFDRLVFDLADVVLVAINDGEPVGFVLCMVEGADYASLNYKWIAQRYPAFAYVDRVAVAEVARGLGVGGKLYQAAFRHYDGVRTVVTAEVNLEPPNPGSIRFHERCGFVSVGERWDDGGGKGVVYMERRLTDIS